MFELERDAIVADLEAARYLDAETKLDRLLPQVRATALVIGPRQADWGASEATLQHAKDVHFPVLQANPVEDANLSFGNQAANIRDLLLDLDRV